MTLHSLESIFEIESKVQGLSGEGVQCSRRTEFVFLSLKEAYNDTRCINVEQKCGFVTVLLTPMH